VHDFDYDVMQKKRLAHQAKYRKRGSKSKKCPMSTDHMTRKQWEERCGKVYTYNLNDPQSWDSFKGWPVHIQKEYLELLVRNYNVNASSLATMFGVRPATVRRLIDTNNLGITFKVGNSMNAAQRAQWLSFIGQESSEAEEVLPEQEEPAIEQEKADVYQPVSQINNASDMDMKQFSLIFQGKIDVGMIANSIRSILGQEASGKIEIVCTL